MSSTRRGSVILSASKHWSKSTPRLYSIVPMAPSPRMGPRARRSRKGWGIENLGRAQCQCRARDTVSGRDFAKVLADTRPVSVGRTDPGRAGRTVRRPMLFFRRRLCWFFLVFFFLVVLSLLLLGILRTLITHEGPPSEIVRYEGEAPDSLRPARRFAPSTPHHNRHVKH